jgi:hypothetical protein
VRGAGEVRLSDIDARSLVEAVLDSHEAGHGDAVYYGLVALRQRLGERGLPGEAFAAWFVAVARCLPGRDEELLAAFRTCLFESTSDHIAAGWWLVAAGQLREARVVAFALAEVAAGREDLLRLREAVVAAEASPWQLPRIHVLGSVRAASFPERPSSARTEGLNDFPEQE